MLAFSLLGTANVPATFKTVGKEISGSQTQARSLEERRLLTGVTTYNSNEAQQSPATITVGGSGSTPGVVATSLRFTTDVKQLRSGDFLAHDERLRSSMFATSPVLLLERLRGVPQSGAWFLAFQRDSNLCLYDGSGPSERAHPLRPAAWCSGPLAAFASCDQRRLDMRLTATGLLGAWCEHNHRPFWRLGQNASLARGSSRWRHSHARERLRCNASYLRAAGSTHSAIVTAPVPAPGAALPTDQAVSRFCIVSGLTLDRAALDNDLHKAYLSIAYRGVSQYSNLHGYSFNPIFFAARHEHIGVQRCRMTQQLFRRNQCDWAFWYEGDMAITNYSTRLETLVLAAAPTAATELIFSRDMHGNINTGSGFVRNSPSTLATLECIIEMQQTEKHSEEVLLWEHNGAIARLYDTYGGLWRQKILLAQQRLFNAYDSNWRPGDFLVHFPGIHKSGMHAWLKAHPPETWIGFEEFRIASTH
jgi:hypothetical protein